MVDGSVEKSVKNYLKKLEEAGYGECYAVVYGSQATGSADSWSDIDILVVSPLFDREIKRGDINTLWRIAAETDSRIEPVPVGELQYAVDDGNALIELARRGGHIIKPAA